MKNVFSSEWHWKWFHWWTKIKSISKLSQAIKLEISPNWANARETKHLFRIVEQLMDCTTKLLQLINTKASKRRCIVHLKFSRFDFTWKQKLEKYQQHLCRTFYQTFVSRINSISFWSKSKNLSTKHWQKFMAFYCKTIKFRICYFIYGMDGTGCGHCF